MQTMETMKQLRDEDGDHDLFFHGNSQPYGSMATVWEGTANPPNYSKLYPSPTSWEGTWIHRAKANMIRMCFFFWDVWYVWADWLFGTVGFSMSPEFVEAQVIIGCPPAAKCGCHFTVVSSVVLNMLKYHARLIFRHIQNQFSNSDGIWWYQCMFLTEILMILCGIHYMMVFRWYIMVYVLIIWSPFSMASTFTRKTEEEEFKDRLKEIESDVCWWMDPKMGRMGLVNSRSVRWGFQALCSMVFKPGMMIPTLSLSLSIYRYIII